MNLLNRISLSCGLLGGLLMLCSSCNMLNRGNDVHARQRSEELAKQNLHSIAHELDKWSSAHNGLFPDDINVLISSGNFTSFPQNPASLSEMRNVKYEDSERSGNFTYYPVYGPDSVQGYYLLVYGFEGSRGEDVDGNGTDDNVLLELSSSTQGLPPLAEVVHGSHSTPPEIFAKLDNIKSRLEQWSASQQDGGGAKYPASLSGTAPIELPANPFGETAMRQIGIHDPDYAGNFAYVPFSLNGVVRGFYLLGFGREGTAGFDVNNDGAPDHVVKVLREGPDSMPTLPILLGQLGAG